VIYGLALILGAVGIARAQDEQTIKGLIAGRDGANMIVKGPSGNVTIALNDATQVEAVKGAFGFKKETMGLTALVPGLPVEVKFTGSPGQFTATKIKFKADDLKTANEIQAGLTPTNQQLQSTEKQVQANKQQIAGQEEQIQSNQAQIAANQEKIQQVQGEQVALSKRFGELGDYDVKGTVTVFFPVNSASLSESDRAKLKQLATQAMTLNGYMIQVAGYTDASGNARYNQELSDRRAQGVIEYLQQSCAVPLFRVLAPAAMGMSDPAASNETAQGKAENRRVVVKVLVNRGIAGG
jgi:outer membrane protein OmpA-like peptidoglycan-associated protein